MDRRLVDVIICAHNEEPTVAGVVRAVVAAGHTCHCLVVADRCTDRTAELARAAGAVVVEVDAGDKGSAMANGLEYAATETVAFVDADLTGLTPYHVQLLLVSPPRPGMVVGLRDGWPVGFGRLPSISGERRIPRALAEEVALKGAGWEAELRINAACQMAGLAWAHIVMHGVKNPRRNKPEEWLKVTGAAVKHLGPLGRMLAATRKVVR